MTTLAAMTRLLSSGIIPPSPIPALRENAPIQNVESSLQERNQMEREVVRETTGAAQAPNGTKSTWTRTGSFSGTVSIIEIVQSPPTVEDACHGQDCR